MEGALAGLPVVDLTNHPSGSCCTMLPGDGGADVIRVERPDGGDDAGRMPPMVDGLRAPCFLRNRNRRSIARDPKSPESAAVLRRLIGCAGMLVENMRPGALACMGCDRALNQQQIQAPISGFGQTGPWAEHGGFDLMAQVAGTPLRVQRPAPALDDHGAEIRH